MKHLLGHPLHPSSVRANRGSACGTAAGLRSANTIESHSCNSCAVREIRVLQACELHHTHLGNISYVTAEALQRHLVERVKMDNGLGFLLTLEHEPVITLGRAGKTEHIKASPQELAERGIEVAKTCRGGAATYHGPGQLVAYPVVPLRPQQRTLQKYVHALEQATINTALTFGIKAERRENCPGVWVNGAKLASVGVAVQKWVAWHGVALNVCCDLSPFDLIAPCGMPGCRMTSLSDQPGRHISAVDVAPVLARELASSLGVTLVEMPAEALP